MTNLKLGLDVVICAAMSTSRLYILPLCFWSFRFAEKSNNPVGLQSYIIKYACANLK